MKTILMGLVAALIATPAVAGGLFDMKKPKNSDGLMELAYTGSGDQMEYEGRGVSIHAMPEGPWVMVAEEELEMNEFLAPHWLHGYDNKIYIMVAPHLKIDGEVVKGAGPDDNFIVVKYNKKGEWEAERFDYSEDY